MLTLRRASRRLHVVEVRHLQAFVAVSDELHFGRAAATLQLSPSPVSRTVQELEHELGLRLFIRSHHRVQLTDAGAALLPTARRLLDDWSAWAARGRKLGQQAAMPSIRIGSPTLAPSGVVDRVVGVLGELYPDVSVVVDFAMSVELVSALRRHELDLTVAHLPLDEPDLSVMPLARYRVGLLVPSDHELAQRTEVSLSDLLGRRVLQLSSSLQPAAMDRANQWLTSVGAIVEQLPDSDLIRLTQLVRHGRGVALASGGGVAEQVFTQPGLAVVPMGENGPRIELGLVWRASDDKSRLMSELGLQLSRLVRDSLWEA